MATGQLSGVIRHLCRATLPRAGADLSDGHLLEAFLAHRDEAAFAALVQRHGPMVFGVGRRVLGNAHDAEDAFQATFLVLARKANSVRPRELVGNWLYGVAFRTALKAKTLAARRRAREKRAGMAMPTTTAAEETVWRDLQPLLDQEVNRLAEKYRVPVVLCDLEGKSQREAARQLGWPEGTLYARLSRARRLLAQRLTRRGVALSAGALAVILSQQTATACVPTALASSTIKAATLVAAGQAATAVLSAEVAALTQGVLQAMFLTKLKTALLLVLTVALLGTGGGLLTRQVLAHDAVAEPTPAPVQRKPAEPATPPGGRDGPAAVVAGKVVGVAKDGKAMTVEAPPKERGGDAMKHEIKLTDKTKLVFSGVGPGGAKLGEGQYAQVWTVEGSKDVAARIMVTGKESLRSQADVTGRVTGVSKDGMTLTFAMPPRERGGEGKTVDIRLTAKTTLRYSHVAKGGTKPTEGYFAEVWLERGSKDKAAKVYFGGDEQRPERGTAEKRPEAVGKVVGVLKDGKGVTVVMPPQARGEEPKKQEIQFDDKTSVVYRHVGPNGDRPTEGYFVMLWLAEGSTDKAVRAIFQGIEQEGTILRGKVAGSAKDGKSLTLELRPMERGEEGKKVSLKITEHSRVIYQGVGPDGARLTDGYFAQVWLEEGSSDTIARVVLTVGEGGRR